MPTYTIHFVNNSNASGDFVVFQKNPNSPDTDVFPLAWHVRPSAPHSKLSISWNLDFYFFWAKTGKLRPGIVFNAGEALRANLAENNSITLVKEDGNYKFVHGRPNGNQGTLAIHGDYSVPADNGSVAIGMSGAPAFAVQAKPAWMSLFKPQPAYWVMFGDFKQGQVVDPSALNGAPEVIFPHGIYSMVVTFNAGNNWTIEPGLD